MTTNPHAVGIDLGNTNTMLASVNAKGKTEIVKHATGALTIPSAVFFDDARTIVGEEALLRGRLHPQRFATQVKNELGANHYHQPIAGVNLPPEVIQACLLRQLRGTLTAKLPGERRVALAVPAIFNELQRRSLMEAAEMAGLHGVDLVDEPIAAVLAYAEEFPLFLLNSPPQDHCLFLVLNLGGYSSEVSLLAWSNNELATMATEFDSHLGGHEWDLRLVDVFAERKIKAGLGDPRESPLELQRLLEAASQCKIKLDSSPEHALKVSKTDSDFRITANEFNSITADLRKRLEQLIDKVFASTKQDPKSVQHTLLVGGASQMHFLHELILRKTGRTPEVTVNSGEAIARGAACHAWRQVVIESQTTAKHLNLASVCTQSVGIEEMDAVTGNKRIEIFIPRGTKLPTATTKQLLTHARESTLSLPLMQGSEVDAHPHWQLIGRAELTNLPADALQDWPLDITIKMGINGRITLDAVVRYTSCAAHLVLHRPDCVSATHVQRWQPVVESQGGISSYLQVARQEQSAPMQLPVAIATNQPPSTPEPIVSPQNAPNAGLFDFIQRLMPSFFRKGPSITATAKLETDDSEKVSPPPHRPPPPMLEIISTSEDATE